MRNVLREMAEKGITHPHEIQAELHRLWMWVDYTARQPTVDGWQLAHYLHSYHPSDTVYLSHYVHPQLTGLGWRWHFDIRLPTGETRHIYV